MEDIAYCTEDENGNLYVKMEDIAYCTEDENGNLYVTNYQYQGNVNYCPFCGFKSRKIIDNQKETK